MFGITIINHAAAVAAAQGQAAIKALAGADLPTVLARLDAGLPIDGGVLCCAVLLIVCCAAS